MENKWTLRIVFLLAVCLTRNRASGTDDKTSKEPSNRVPSAKLEESRYQRAEVGHEIILQCTNPTIDWNNMIYVIWKISTQKNVCQIAVAANDSDNNTCNDGQNRILKQNYSLVIPDFSIEDAGNYTCDVSYVGGALMETVHVSAWVHPQTSSWLEAKGGHTFAVCEALSLPKAEIRWEPDGTNSSMRTTEGPNGLFTVTSWLELPKDASLKTLACVVNQTELSKFRLINFKLKDPSVEWPFILLGVCATCSIVSLLTGLYLTRDKLGQLRVFRKICCTSQISQAPREEKPPQPQDPEEVEPYASYVQRVNSIYNSSAELFNA